MTAQVLRIFWWQIARSARRHRVLAVCNILSIALGIAVFLAIRIANLAGMLRSAGAEISGGAAMPRWAAPTA